MSARVNRTQCWQLLNYVPLVFLFTHLMLANSASLLHSRTFRVQFPTQYSSVCAILDCCCSVCCSVCTKYILVCTSSMQLVTKFLIYIILARILIVVHNVRFGFVQLICLLLCVEETRLRATDKGVRPVVHYASDCRCSVLAECLFASGLRH